MTVNVIKIQDTSKGTKSVDEDLEAVAKHPELHQGSAAGFRILYRDIEVTRVAYLVGWESARDRQK